GIRDLTVTGVQTCALPILPTLDIATAAVTLSSGGGGGGGGGPSSGLVAVGADAGGRPRVRLIDLSTGLATFDFEAFDHAFRGGEIGRASCRERVESGGGGG